MQGLKGTDLELASARLGMLFCSPFCRISFTPVDPSDYGHSDEEPYIQLLIMATFGNAAINLTEEQVISALKQTKEAIDSWSDTLAEFMEELSDNSGGDQS